VDFRAGELWNRGVRIPIQEKPLRVLEALLERPGEVATRDELRRRLWPDATFVDFDHGINIAVGKLRRALGDSAAHPRWIETLARHGYRLLTEGMPEARRVLLAVLPFLHLDGDHGTFGDCLTEEATTQLARLDSRRLGVIARATAVRYKDAAATAGEIGRELGIEYILEGAVRVAADRVRITAQLIQVADQTHLWAQTYDRRLTDALDVQREVTLRIVRAVGRRLLA
jgi:TolB-like protein